MMHPAIRDLHDEVPGYLPGSLARSIEAPAAGPSPVPILVLPTRPRTTQKARERVAMLRARAERMAA